MSRCRWTTLATVWLSSLALAWAQLNRAPQFLPGGDMARFSLPEDTPVGAPVYKLIGSDPEGSAVHYSISGEHFTVDRKSGVVTLLKKLDRESLDLLEVIISITDESVGGVEPNTVSLRREIPVLDVNDNPPVFSGRPYSFSVSEATKVGTVLYSNISVTDRDIGLNAEITIICVSADPCRFFEVTTEKIGEGQYMGIISLARQLDFETQSGYSLVLQASDANVKQRLTATANVIIDVKDIQDQVPIFLNAPYSATLQENTPPGYSVAFVRAQDGDLGEPRTVALSLEGDDLNYFTLNQNSSGQGTIVTSDTPIDREHPTILENGGVYTFSVKATELINNELPGDFSYEQVTVVITDVDDLNPVFNQKIFRINVSEDIGICTPLPGLNMVVSDGDVGDNAHYSLSLKSSDTRVLQWFKVEPVSAHGQTPVVIRVNDNNGLDYDEGVRQLAFTVVALTDNEKGELTEVSSSEVRVIVQDANDNSPVFGKPEYSYTIQEDLAPGSLIAKLSATDLDSNAFGTITYYLRGFGTDKFGTDLHEGNLYIIDKVDYEKQRSYSLTLEAKDGGGRVASVNILVHLSDVNDNAPIFEVSEYRRTVREGATTFQPQFFVRAIDADKDGNTHLTYRIISTNSDVLTVDSQTGEIKMVVPVSSSHTSRGQYELTIRAADDGVPPLNGDVPVFVRVGVPGNQRPVFRGAPYNVTIPENSLPNTEVVTVRATDPDGADSLVEYRIATGADNFYIGNSSGIISVSSAAILDPDITSMRLYEVTVLAVDSGTPLRETAQTTVLVNIADVNNKPPTFSVIDNYIRHISERTAIDETVLVVHATDPDLNAELEYSLVEPIRAADKTGAALKDTSIYDYKHAFRINSTTGAVIVNSSLDHQAAAVIILTVQARDKQAKDNLAEQITKVEVTLYIQAYNELNPKFNVASWSPTDPTIRVNVPEEKPVGSILVRLTAIDSPTNLPISYFTPITPLPKGLALHTNGDIELTHRLDYENIENKTLSFRVQAVSDDNQRKSEALVLLMVKDINDHTPMFTEQSYRGTVLESAAKDTVVMKVKATDGDMAKGSEGYGDIRYSLAGENAHLFSIDSITGEIKVSTSSSIDREKQSILRLIATAADMPEGGANQRKTSVPVIIEVIDVNDNAPVFSATQYTAVVLENVAPYTSVVNLTATDMDKGPGGEITYEIINEGEASGLFSLGMKSGELKTAKALTGKGRKEPYSLAVRAQDSGDPSLFMDAPLKIFIGDVVTNDGIPSFLHPTLEEMAYISENASIGSPVFRVVAADPDDPNSPEGQLRYSFLQDVSDSVAFKIDPETGLITIRQTLDREKKDRYALILVAQDSGMVPQQATRELHVIVTDIDDHKPYFKRSLDDAPLEMAVNEELEIGSPIGTFQAFDQDMGENADIGYLITYGNEDGIFLLNRTDDNKVVLIVGSRLDRESVSEYVITVKCFKLSVLPLSLRKQYNRQDPSERQIKIRILDIDDNLPQFEENNITIGVRVNVPVDTLLLTVSATDIDIDAAPISYHLDAVTFSLPLPVTVPKYFSLDNKTGELRTATPMSPFSDGHFTLTVLAMNSPNHTQATIKVFIVRERGLLRFVFSRPPTDVRQSLPDFRKDFEKALDIPAALNIYDTQFHAKQDGSLDFSSTSSCFQLVGERGLDLKEMEALLKPGDNPNLDKVYTSYNVQSVQRCAVQIGKAEVTWVQLCVLGIACFIGFASIVSGCVLCFSYNRWQRFR